MAKRRKKISGGIEKENLLAGMQDFFSSMQEGVAVLDPLGKIVYINPTASAILDILGEDAVGKKAAEVFMVRCLKPDSNDFWDRVFMGESAVAIESDCSFIRRLEKDNLVSVAGSASPLYVGDGTLRGFIFVFRDVTDENRMKQRQYEFLSFAAHQLRTPIAHLRWGLDLVMFEKDRLSDQARDMLMEMHKGVLRTIDLLGTLLNVARLQEGKFILNPEAVTVEKVIKDSIAPVDRLAAGFNVILDILPKNLSGAAGEKIFVDTKRFRDIMQNLLSNAVRYNRPKGAVTVGAEKVSADDLENIFSKTIFAKGISEYVRKIEKLREDCDFVLISVADTGVGIPKDDQPKIFANYFRASNALKMQIEGIGIGLFFVKAIIDLSGGYIFFKSSEGRGTTFYVVFPAHK